MIKPIDFILELFRDEDHAQAFVNSPDQALADAGFSNVTSAQLQAVAASAVPSLAMGGDGDAVAGLQQAVSATGHRLLLPWARTWPVATVF